MDAQLKTNDLLCFSHLRWNFVFQRPQHLMSRFAKKQRVFFIEEPAYETGRQPHIRRVVCDRTGVEVLTPVLPPETLNAPAIVRQLLQGLLQSLRIVKPIAWFYSPMWLESFPEKLDPAAVIYDCMDELSLFKGAPPQLQRNENKLFKMADLVFTGGVSLYEYKRDRHANIFPFPSGVDVSHFAQARSIREERPEQAHIPHPRIGYAGVIDERIDIDLIRDAALLRPDWNFIMIGPVVKINPESLPQAKNLHWLGMQDYRDLPSFFAGWDVAMMPFEINDATRFISPTKTPEFLSAGLPVVSTPVRDVVRPYGDLGLARIVTTAEEFVAACDQAFACRMGMKWRKRADAFLATMSWDSVWSSMNSRITSLFDSQKHQPKHALDSMPKEAAHV